MRGRPFTAESAENAEVERNPERMTIIVQALHGTNEADAFGGSRVRPLLHVPYLFRGT